MASGLQLLLELLEVDVARLNTPQPAFPGKKPQADDGEEDERNPSGGRGGPARVVCDHQHQHRDDGTDDCAIFDRVNEISLHERGDVVQVVVVLDGCVIEAKHMNLGRRHAVFLQLLFEMLEVIKIVADEVVPQHFHALSPAIRV